MNEPDRPDRVEHRAEHTRELPAAPEQLDSLVRHLNATAAGGEGRDR